MAVLITAMCVKLILMSVMNSSPRQLPQDEDAVVTIEDW